MNEGKKPTRKEWMIAIVSLVVSAAVSIWVIVVVW